MGSVELDFFTDLFDVDCHSGDIADTVHIPDPAEKLILAEDMVGILCQECEQIKLLGRKILFRAVHKDTPCSLIDLETADLHDIVGLLAGADQAPFSLKSLLQYPAYSHGQLPAKTCLLQAGQMISSSMDSTESSSCSRYLRITRCMQVPSPSRLVAQMYPP